MTERTLKQTKRKTKLQFAYKQMSHVTKAAEIEVFLIQKHESALAGTNRLVKDRSRKSGLIQERSLTQLAPTYVSCLQQLFLSANLNL